jgi:Flp pilus assembly protein TadD
VRATPLALRPWLARHAGWIAAAALYALLRRSALGGLSAGLAAPVDALAWLGFVGQGSGRLVWPVGLTIAPPPPGAGDAAAGALALATAAAATLVAWRRRAPWLVPLVTGSAMLAIAGVGAVRVGELGDRYLLLPACAGAALLAGGVEALPVARRRAARTALAALAAAFALTSVRHVQVYESDGRLWREAWERNPAALRPPLNLAAWHLERGETTEALGWLERASALAPDDPQVALNRAVAAEQLGDHATARRVLAELLERDAGAWPVRLRLAHLALDEDRLDEAASHYEEIVRVHPLAAEAWAGLGVARQRQGHAREAAAAIDRALALDPAVQNADALRRLRRDLAP